MPDLNNASFADVTVGPFPLESILAQSSGYFLTGEYIIVISPDKIDPTLWWLYGYGGPKPETLDQAKQQKCDAIDAQSELLIAKGFTYNGMVFSLSDKAQIKWLGLAVGSSMIPYPYPVPTLDNLQVYSIPDAATVQAMYGTAMMTVGGILGSGTGLKTAVNACLTIDDVNAIVDPR